mgnify:CR=1 FL=1
MSNINWVREELKNIRIDDGRIVNRAISVVKSLASTPGESIPKACGESKKIKAAYRLLANEKLTAEKVLESHKNQTIKRIDGQKIVLSVQDTTELDYNTLEGTEGLGPYGGKEDSKGLIMHSTLAVSTEGVPYGILGENVWARNPEERGKSKKCRKYPIEQKESYKWLKSMDESREGVPGNIKLVDVCDRDADLYEFLYKGVCEEKSFVVRAKHDRLIKETDKKLYRKLENLPVAGVINIDIPRDSRSKLPPRKAKFNVKFDTVSIIAPQYLPEKYKAIGNLTLHVVMVEEINPPHKKKPIKWILFTDMEVSTLEQAVEKVKWYKHRWKIERFHYVLKSGCKIEELQFESAEHLIKAIALHSIIAWKILWFVYEARETPNMSCEVVLEPFEWKMLDCIVNKKTTPSKTPLSLKDAALFIAKLGGFWGRKGDGTPGAKVLWRGLNELKTLLKHADIIKNAVIEK